MKKLVFTFLIILVSLFIVSLVFLELFLPRQPEAAYIASSVEGSSKLGFKTKLIQPKLLWREPRDGNVYLRMIMRNESDLPIIFLVYLGGKDTADYMSAYQKNTIVIKNKKSSEMEYPLHFGQQVGIHFFTEVSNRAVFHNSHEENQEFCSSLVQMCSSMKLFFDSQGTQQLSSEYTPKMFGTIYSLMVSEDLTK